MNCQLRGPICSFVQCAQDMAIRGSPENLELELLWRGAHSYGSSADVFTGNFYSGVCFCPAPSKPCFPFVPPAFAIPACSFLFFEENGDQICVYILSISILCMARS